ncbi:MAG: hypothetical protein NVSMB51_17130 [Solirubrobacteraceae bacterium]
MVALVALGLVLPAIAPAARSKQVLLVGSYKGRHGAYRSIQSAVDAAHRGDVILVAPGVYHEQGDHAGRHSALGAAKAGAGLWIGKPGLTIRGLDRNGVVLDGTLPHSGAACSPSAARQDLGPAGADGKPLGRNGIEVYRSANVSIENLTACNFLKGAGGGGNQIWFNGGDGSGQTVAGRFFGAYLSATSSYFGGAGSPDAAYGIFVSNSRGPGRIVHTYASNQDDSSYYIGACRDCNTVLDDAHAQYSALGYSGTNSGGHLVVENSEWDHNQTGIVTNSQNNDDAPSPALGWCPGSATRSCTFFRANNIHDNNNPNVPSSGAAAFGPVGAGLVLAGVRGDTVTRNNVHDNGSWGIVSAPYPDSETPPAVAHCEGGSLGVLPGFCYYDDFGNEISRNKFSRNGAFHNPTNGDMADISMQNTLGNCWHDNSDATGPVSSAPANLQQSSGTCAVANHGAGIGDPVATQLICDTQLLGPCAPSVGSYPRTAKVVMPKLRPQTTMPNPCRGLPANAWCAGR